MILLKTKYILGIQAILWSEMILNFKRLQYQAFPRLLAMAETARTSKDDKNFNDFQRRMKLQYNRLDALGIRNYIPSVTGLKDKVEFLDKATIELKTSLENMDIFYTTDGSMPTKTSTKYTSPLEFSETTTLKTIAFRGGIASETKSALIEKQALLEPIDINLNRGSIKRRVDHH